MESLAPRDRPRERLRELGPRALGTTELIAIIVGSGGRGHSALAIGHAVLGSSAGSLRTLAARPVAAIARVAGIGPARATALAAAFELGRRAAAEGVTDRPAIHRPADVMAVFAPQLEALGVEEFHVAILDAQHNLERTVCVSRGILDSALVHPREVFREAIAEQASSIILVHNHPSGDPTPSTEDKVVTAQLVAAGKLLGIPVRDHLVIGRGRYVSFAEAGWLQTDS